MNASTPITPLEPPPATADGHAVQQAHTAYTTAWARIECAAATACGSTHERNEDAHSPLHATGGGRLFVVADGVGGGAMARTASRQLVARLHRALDGRRIDPQHIRDAVLEADRAIARLIIRRAGAPGAATLVLCAPANLLASKWFVGWVGDCRAYRIAEEGAVLLTSDDSFRNLSETPPPGSAPDDPARMVGNGATTGANLVRCDLQYGELLLLCSDGVHKHLAPADFTRLVADPAAPASLARCCHGLIALARRRGSSDDATALLLRHRGFTLPRPHWSA